MVHPYLRRRNEEELPTVPHPALEKILERTLGVPLFQEQVMQIAIDGAGYSGGEADQLRRDMAAWKRNGKLLRHRERLLAGFEKKGISLEFGAALFEQIKGFGDYGFPESHAASFALLVYTSSWQKANHPAHFACALLNSQPMGFYAPHTILADARRHGVEVRDVDIARSSWDSTLEVAGESSGTAPGGARAIRVGFRLIKGIGEAAGRRIEAARAEWRFSDIEDVRRRAELRRDEVEALAEAGAFESLLPGRRQALWASRAPRLSGLFEGKRSVEPRAELPPLSAAETLLLDYRRKHLSAEDHPMRHLRERLAARGVLTARELALAPQRRKVRVAGVVICRQQPGTASGVVFITLEDETGFSNLVLWRRVFDEFRVPATRSAILLAEGDVERQPPGKHGPEERDVIHVIVRKLERLDVPGRDIQKLSRDFH
jgi:error-prone DNA polymerase